MKKTLLVILLIIPFFGYSQNYQCLQAGVKHYFINGNGYLRGIRIDSGITLGDTTVYYPFHTPRGPYAPSLPLSPTILDSNGGSWLGKRVLQLNDGTFIFDSYWNDSVTIKTQANIGDSWIFYKDTSTLYYKATMMAIDTMTVLGALDSVKTIMITAQNPSGIVTSDPLDSFNIMLSKNNGFVQVFDLYTFPYHKPDSTYRPGLDYFLDRSSCSYNDINNEPGYSPNVSITIFKVVDFINPNEQQLYNWSVGDVIHSDNELGIPIYGTVTYTWLKDTVIDKIVSGHFINYTISGSTFTCPTPPYYPCSLICKAGLYSFSDLVYPLFDTSQLPEEKLNSSNYLFYYPYDSTYCSTSPAYITESSGYYPLGLGWVIENTAYKLGIGKTNFHHADGDPTYETDRLIYYNINGIGCGTPIPNQVNEIILPSDSFQIFPTPATDELTIKTTNTAPYTITLFNMLGQAVQTIQTDQKEQTINVANVPPGVYNVSIIDGGGNRYNDKVVVVH